MKVIAEIGFKKLFKFVLFTFWETIFNWLLFSPLRVQWLRLFGARVGNETIVGRLRFMNLYRKGLAGLKIGTACFLGDDVVFDLAEEIVINDNATLSEQVFVLTHTNVGYKDHPLQKIIPAFAAKVVIGNACFVGVRATIMPGIKMGAKSILGACSLLRSDVGEGEFFAGVPAKLIRKFEEPNE